MISSLACFRKQMQVNYFLLNTPLTNNSKQLPHYANHVFDNSSNHMNYSSANFTITTSFKSSLITQTCDFILNPSE